MKKFLPICLLLALFVCFALGQANSKVAAISPTNQVKTNLVAPAKTNLAAKTNIPAEVEWTPPNSNAPPKPAKTNLPTLLTEKDMHKTNAVPIQVPAHRVMLSWSYPSNQVSPDLLFEISQATNFQKPDFVKLLAAPAGAFARSFDGTNYEFSFSFSMLPMQSVFIIRSSNFWGLGPANVLAVFPPPPLFITNFSVKHL